MASLPHPTPKTTLLRPVSRVYGEELENAGAVGTQGLRGTKKVLDKAVAPFRHHRRPHRPATRVGTRGCGVSHSEPISGPGATGGACFRETPAVREIHRRLGSASRIINAEEMIEAMSDKVRLHLRLTPETYRLIGEYSKKDNCTTSNEFVERAVEFYVGYLSAEDCLHFLPPSLATAVRGTVHDSENRICRLLFKLAVEMNMMMNVLASEVDVSAEALERLRGRCIQEVKKTGGAVTFADAMKYQKGE